MHVTLIEMEGNIHVHVKLVVSVALGRENLVTTSDQILILWLQLLCGLFLAIWRDKPACIDCIVSCK